VEAREKEIIYDSVKTSPFILNQETLLLVNKDSVPLKWQYFPNSGRFTLWKEKDVSVF
jgi:hypothetical protein